MKGNHMEILNDDNKNMSKRFVPAGQEAAVPAKPKKRRRHIMLVVAVVALVLMILGEILGSLILHVCLLPVKSVSDGTAFLIDTYLGFIGIDLVVVLYCLLAEKPILHSFGSAGHGGGAGNTLRLFGLGLLAGFAMNGLCVLAAWLHGDIALSPGEMHPGYLLFALAAVCIQSTAEELLTRGYMMGALRQRYNVWVAIVFNSLFFASLHLFNPGVNALAIADIALFGFALSLVMYYMDSIWFCAAVHTAWNFTQNLIFGLPNSGIVSEASLFHLDAAHDSIFYNVGFGVESTIMAVVTECLLALCVVLWAKKHPKNAGAQRI